MQDIDLFPANMKVSIKMNRTTDQRL